MNFFTEASTARNRVIYYSLLALSLVLLALLVYTIEFRTFFDHLSRLHLGLIGAVVLVYGLAWALRALRLRHLVDQPWNTLDAFRIQIAGFALNLVYPAKLGDLFMGAFLKKKVEVRYQEALAYILHLRVLDFLVLIALAALSLCTLPIQRVSPELWQGVAIGVGLVLVFGAAVLLANRTRLLDLLARFLPKKFDITHLFRQLARFHRFRRAYLSSFLLSLLIWALEVFTCYLIALEVDPSVGFWAVLSAMAIGNIMKAIPLFPGGLGTYEAGFILMLALHGASYETAVSLSIIDHLLKKMMNLAVGFPVYLQLQKEARRSAFEKQGSLT